MAKKRHIKHNKKQKHFRGKSKELHAGAFESDGKKTMSRKAKIFLVVIFFILITCIILKTFQFLDDNFGIFDKDELDDRDKARWIYDGDVILGAEGFFLDSDKEHCWILVHGYTSTPLEMKGLAEVLYNEFGDSILVMRLSGHGEVPSRLVDKDIKKWYAELYSEYDSLAQECKKINLVSSSLSVSMVLKLAEDRDVGNIYLSNPYFIADNSGMTGPRQEAFWSFMADWMDYIKKKKVGNINDPVNVQKHVAYYNMPMNPIRDSIPFIKQVLSEIPDIDKPILVLHGMEDVTSKPKIVQAVYDRIASEDKKIVWYQDSNHVLLMDYDRYEAFEEIVEFEKQRR